MRWLWGVLASALILVGLSACSSNFAVPNDKEKVVYLTDGRIVGSGFFIADDLILTNRHVVKAIGKKCFTVRLYNGETHKGCTQSISVTSDLALVKVETPEEDPYFKVACKSPEYTATVKIIGHPYGQFEWHVGWGKVTGEVFQNFFNISIDLYPGNSGGPVIDERGRVVGVATASFLFNRVPLGVGFATPAEDICRFLNKS